MSNFFGQQAAEYWANGFSVIPIEPGTKQPSRGITNWTGYCDNLPKPESRAGWLQTYQEHGIDYVSVR